MGPTFLEMGFSADGSLPLRFPIYVSREGWLYRKVKGEFKPLNPELGNARGVYANSNAYWYIQAGGKKYVIYRNDIEEYGVNAGLKEID